MIVSVFGDESHDETKQRVFAVSGVFGTEAEWETVITPWLEYTKGEEVHVADWEHKGRKNDIKALTQILAKSDVAAFAVSLDLCSFREHLGEAMNEMGYFKCLTDILRIMMTETENYNPRGPSQPITGLEFTFDHRKPTEGNAGTLYQLMATLREWDDAEVFSSKISFDTRSNPSPSLPSYGPSFHLCHGRLIPETRTGRGFHGREASTSRATASSLVV
jgi:hypothetical protein